uniref:Uncharacterized protein n=1 Tax=Rhizophora mucronata TaxID=61149 RepID=A0A2P2LUF5_RHIMU
MDKGSTHCTSLAKYDKVNWRKFINNHRQLKYVWIQSSRKVQENFETLDGKDSGQHGYSYLYVPMKDFPFIASN